MPSMPGKFAELPYTRPDMERLQAEYATLVQQFKDAGTAAEFCELVRVWNRQRSALRTNASLARTRYTLNVMDEEARREKEFLDEAMPTIREWNVQVAQAIVSSPFRADADREWGPLFLTLVQRELETFNPSIKPLLVKEAKLSQRYTDIFAEGEVEFEGKYMNLSEIDKFCSDPDRSVRKRATETKYAYIEGFADELDEIYDNLVRIRHEKARALGFENFVEFRYCEMGRNDYNADDVAKFRRQVEEIIVPLSVELRERQAHRLGIDTLYLHDENIQFPEGNPRPKGDPAWIVDQAASMYSDLSTETGSFFTMMTEHELMDLATRRNKAGGGYCTSFPEHGVPFIFANFNGSAGDVRVLTHEAGHAFQAYSSRKHELLEYRSPTIEACEIHSMAMEFLAWPWMENFFHEGAERFKYYHLQGALLFLPYACAVDEFQHWVYTNIDATPEDRKRYWLAMERKYMPDRTYDHTPYCESGGFWQRQAHIYNTPFYYIDYALAQTCALQFWIRSENDHADALKDYIHICRIGGSQSFLDIVQSAGLISPFEPECLQSVVRKSVAWLEENEESFEMTPM